MMASNFFDFHFSDSEVFDFENIIMMLSLMTCNDMKMFKCMWIKVYLNTINGKYGKNVLCQYEPILTNQFNI